MLSDADRVMSRILIGSRDSKRTIYLEQAAGQQNAPLILIPWDKSGRLPALPEGRHVIKIDPPADGTYEIAGMEGRLRRYQNELRAMERDGHIFLNTPDAICEALDKRACKSRLQGAGLPVTPLLPGSFAGAEELLAYMERAREYAVFVKPNLYSGAAGVMALRLNPRGGRVAAYASCALREGKLVNTKKLRRLENREEIGKLLDALLVLDTVVERWMPKDTYRGKSYDLRAVYQFGHIAFLVARLSDGPITNLHLNNRALGEDALGLGEEKRREIEELCRSAMSLFPGLTVAGIDILLEKNSKKSYIIEINGQGDLMYQDIYGDNRIYREQAERMEQWSEELTEK